MNLVTFKVKYLHIRKSKLRIMFAKFAQEKVLLIMFIMGLTDYSLTS